MGQQMGKANKARRGTSNSEIGGGVAGGWLLHEEVANVAG